MRTLNLAMFAIVMCVSVFADGPLAADDACAPQAQSYYHTSSPPQRFMDNFSRRHRGAVFLLAVVRKGKTTPVPESQPENPALKPLTERTTSDLNNVDTDINSGKCEFGTAFVVQNQPPLLITAHHVVENKVDNPDDYVVFGRSSDYPDQWVPLKVTDSLVHADFALLTFEKSEPTLYSQAVDIYPVGSHSQKPMTVSFPGMAVSEAVTKQACPDANGMPKLDAKADYLPAVVSEVKPGGPLSSRTGGYDGDSGAPLIMDEGLAIGVVIKRNLQIKVSSSPIYLGADWITRHVAYEQAQTVLDKILNKDNWRPQSVDFNPGGCRDCISNLALLKAVDALSWDGDLVKSNTELIKCRLSKILWARNLFAAASRVDSLLNRFGNQAVGNNLLDSAARTILEADRSAKTEEGKELAKNLYSLAENTLISALIEKLQNEELLSRALSPTCAKDSSEDQVRQGAVTLLNTIRSELVDETFIERAVGKTECGRNYFNRNISALLLELVNVRSRLSLLKVEKERLKSNNIASLVAWGSLLQKDKTASRRFFNTLQSVAQAAFEQKDRVFAAQVYGWLWHGNVNRTSVGNSYNFARTMALDENQPDAGHLPKNISTAESLDLDTLRAYAYR